VENGGQVDSSTFRFFIGAVVQDVNGNPVADGTEVHFSAFVSGLAVAVKKFDRWSGLGGTTIDEIKPIWHYEYYDIPFEDVNNNLRMDPGIDLCLDINNAVARRGDDVNGDGTVDFNFSMHDYFYDFNGNGICDLVTEPYIRVMDGSVDTLIFMDMNGNNQFDDHELAVDWNGNGLYDGPASGDFPYPTWEARYWLTHRVNNGPLGNIAQHSLIPQFDNNDFAVTIEASAVTVKGVAKTAIEYPRQFANILFATVNAEADGKRDGNGERFILPVIRGE
jgi:hypothetical protein